MLQATNEFLQQTDKLFEKRKNDILTSKDEVKISGTVYYVSNDGDDENDGLSEITPWQTLKKVSEAYLYPGDGVLFKRGDLFRGTVYAKPGVTYAAYGNGDKPKFYGCEVPLGEPNMWELIDSEHNIYKCTKPMLDAGTLVFNDGEAHSRKLIPTYKNLEYVCRYDESKPFVMAEEMTEDLDIFWFYDTLLTRTPSKGKDFPIPHLEPEVFNTVYGDLYLRCDKGNPGEVFDTIESVARVHCFVVKNISNVTIDNLCMKYIGMHGVMANRFSVGLHVSNCEIGWIGGTIQTFNGGDPNYPEGGRGSVTRFGNGIEVYGGCDDYIVTNNYIYESYDAGITHQVTTPNKLTMTNVIYSGNLIEKCVYGIEYFLDDGDGKSGSYMKGIVMDNNFIRLSGYGWGQQRHNQHTPAAIKGWSHSNPASDFVIKNNIFDRSAYRMLHLVALKDEWCPTLEDNTYIQHEGGMIGQYGGNEVKEPDIMMVDENTDDTIVNVFGDKSAKVYVIK